MSREPEEDGIPEVRGDGFKSRIVVNNAKPRRNIEKDNK